ncbi:MAG: hypothetical protein JWO78_1612 [Micavibrio sp.]|nr:hypothetical protein [Micavibrio sp.]
MQHNNAIHATLLESLAEAETGAFTNIDEIIRLSEEFSKWIGLNPAMKEKVRSEVSEQEHQDYKTHMGAMLIALRDAKDSPKKATLDAAAGIERLKALNVMAGAAMRAFTPAILSMCAPEELEEPRYLSQIRNLHLGNMAALATISP